MTGKRVPPTSSLGSRAAAPRPARHDADPNARRAEDSSRQAATVQLHDGTSVTLRPITPEDQPLLIDVFDGMSEESRYRRFFTSLQMLSPRLLSDYTRLDHRDREAIIAIDPNSARALGIARYVRLTEDPDKAEVAVAVIDDWHGRGLGSALLSELTRRAQQAGIARFVANVQASNRDALELFHATGSSRLENAGPHLELVIELSQVRPRHARA